MNVVAIVSELSLEQRSALQKFVEGGRLPRLPIVAVLRKKGLAAWDGRTFQTQAALRAALLDHFFQLRKGSS